MSWPFYGAVRVTSPYGNRVLNGATDFHKGIDLVGVNSTDVLSVCSGTVGVSTIITDKQNRTWQWGNYVRVDGNDGLKYYYCHMSSRNVKAGEKVVAGTKLGVMGNTGYSFGAHTHFEVRNAQNTSIDPSVIINIPNEKGVYIYMETSSVSPYKAIDISKHQSTFNSVVAKSQGIDTVLCRCAYGTSKDIKFDEFCSNITNAGLALGAYGFLTAHYKSKNGNNFDSALNIAKQQVNTWIDILKNKGITSYVAVDQELETGNVMTLNKSNNTYLLNTTCSMLEKAGYFPCVYASASWIMTYIDVDTLNYPLWVAYYYKYGTQLSFDGLNGTLPSGTYGNFMKALRDKNKLVMWQFTSEGYGQKYGAGSVNLDKNWLYVKLGNGEDKMEFKELSGKVIKCTSEQKPSCELFLEPYTNSEVVGKMGLDETCDIVAVGSSTTLAGMNATWYKVIYHDSSAYCLALPDRCVVEDKPVEPVEPDKPDEPVKPDKPAVNKDDMIVSGLDDKSKALLAGLVIYLGGNVK